MFIKKTVLWMLMAALCAGSAQAKLFKGICKVPQVQVPVDQLPPIFYREEYNISPFWGIEKLFHPFDGCKYGKVAEHLRKVFDFVAFRAVERVTDSDLRKIHTESYLAVELKKSHVIGDILGMSFLGWFPISFLDARILDPMRYAVQGTIEAAQAALTKGWAVNLSGGYHHAKAAEGDGFCVFADIPLAIHILRESNPRLKVLIVDLDAHEGNGHASIIGSDPEKLTYIFDMYSKNNYPREDCVQHVDFPYGLKDMVSTQEYLSCLHNNLPQAINHVQPDLIIYNAGTDIYEKDWLGNMAVTKEGIIQRDGFVFQQALSRKIPILMVLSGGYSPASAVIIGESLESIIKTHTLLPEREGR